MAIETRRRDGREYYYYKLTGGKSVYLGTKDKPNRENVERTYKQFLRNKERLAKEERIFKMLMEKI
jgi:hypothetical protein